MPRENRKRGKKHKKQPAEEQVAAVEETHYEEEPEAGPSWIVPANRDAPQENPEAPFGFVDVDVKAYFRTVDVQLREWQDQQEQAVEGDEDVDPNENRRMFLLASLQEMTGKERELATDPDCSGVLERMTYSMDDFVRRVFMDSLAGSYEQLARHRFASHVVQTLLDVAQDTISRETRGILPAVEDSQDKGELRTLTQLVLNFCEEMLPSISSLIMDPFASHVIRSLLVLLCPTLFTPEKSQNTVRSKKSTAWKVKQGPMKSVLTDEKEKHDKGKVSEASNTKTATPKAFSDAARKIVMAVRNGLGENEVRALSADKVASPVLQMLLEVETDAGMADEPDSLMDRVLVGLITLHKNDPTAIPEPSDFLSTLLRDPTSSHLLETLVLRSPPPIFNILWSVYFKGKLAKLAIHPVANFVVAKAIERINAEQMAEVINELGDVWGKIRASRPGVLVAMVDRAAVLSSMEAEVCKAICDAFSLISPEDQLLSVPCLLSLMTPSEYKTAQAKAEAAKANETSPDHYPSEPPKKRFRKDNAHSPHSPLEPKTAGSLLLQSLLRLPDPHNQLVLNSLQSLPIEQTISLAHNPTSSRVLDVLLDSPAVPSKTKRTFLLGLVGHYQSLVDDRIGSRVGDRCWKVADPYLKEKIARSLFAHESKLAGSFYGKYFARNLNLYLLQRRPDEWRTQQAQAHVQAKQGAKTTATAAQKGKRDVATKEEVVVEGKGEEENAGKKRKRGGKGKADDIDELFEAALGKKMKKGSLAVATTAPVPSIDDDGQPAVLEAEDKDEGAERAEKKRKKEEKKKRKRDGDGEGRGEDKTLEGVLGAIKAAPKGQEKGRGKSKKNKDR